MGVRQIQKLVPKVGVKPTRGCPQRFLSCTPPVLFDAIVSDAVLPCPPVYICKPPSIPSGDTLSQGVRGHSPVANSYLWRGHGQEVHQGREPPLPAALGARGSRCPWLRRCCYGLAALRQPWGAPLRTVAMWHGHGVGHVMSGDEGQRYGYCRRTLW